MCSQTNSTGLDYPTRQTKVCGRGILRKSGRNIQTGIKFNQTTVLEGTAVLLLHRTTTIGLMYHVVASSSQPVNSCMYVW
ncbi:hypothetical protein DPMN_186766 [Dreissena polymorpha]|uniref:Uncharacterized protein n=1 Tax=Dreissena polymorpha TaxID=45954 RepID=A0A9D4I8G1_DREPO|nr:hypothetical protein DPMN_186766 [Dreissena polymorpha]